MQPNPAPGFTRRRTLAALAVLGLSVPFTVHAAERTLPVSSSLPLELQQALGQHQPLVVMVSLHGCPFCAEVRNNYLAPMHEHEGLQVVQVNMLDPHTLISLAGETTTHTAQVQAWGIKLAPTVLFFGQDGKEVAPRLAGGPNDFYSAQLDNRLDAARKAISQ